MEFSTISVVGLGYIGLPTAVLLAMCHVDVVGVDVSQHVVDSINNGNIHVLEPNLESMLNVVLQNGRFHATIQHEPADAFIIAVPTPITTANTPDTSYIHAAAKNLSFVLKKGNLVILESTSPVGTTELMAKWLAELRPDLTFPQQAGSAADVQIAYCPERVIPGKMLDELVCNDRVVGGMSSVASCMSVSLYKIFVNGKIYITDARTAEFCKLTENSFRDVNIAFANELSIICNKLHLNVWEVINLVNMHPRVHILQPGIGVGGHCIAVDPWFIINSVPKESLLIRTARERNNYKPLWILEKIKSSLLTFLSENPTMTITDVTVTCLGLAFKPNIDDLRSSPAIFLVHSLAMLGCKVHAVEPHIKALPAPLRKLGVRLCSLKEALQLSDILCVLVLHTCFVEHSADIAGHDNIFDAVGLFADRKGFVTHV